MRNTRVWGALLPPLVVTLAACTATVSGPSQGTSTGGTGATAGATAAGGTTGGTAASGGTSGSGTGGATGGASGASGTAGASGSTSGSGGTQPSSGPRPVSLEGEPLYTRFVRLTNDQWEHSVREILHLTAATGASDGFQHAVGGTTDFDNNERVVFVDNTAWSDFQLAAEKMAEQVTVSDAALQNVVATTDVASFIGTLGRRAFRRELTADEVQTYQGVHAEGAAAVQGSMSTFTKGARWVISALLQSPYFLYRIELGDDGAPLDGNEMAAKLSLWLRDSTPTDAMLDAADSFATADGAATQAAQMLEDAAAKDVMSKLHAELHKFALFDSISKTNVSGYSTAMNAEFEQASYLFFDRIFTQNLGVRDILTSTVGYAGPAMAPIYGINVTGTAVSEVSLPDRAGYFAQAPFLALWARNNEPDSIHRGARVNLDVLCADPGLPNAVPNIPAATTGQTNRMVIEDLTSGCAAVCHGEIINPIGFAFENFDGVGRTRDTDNGQPVDTAGTYPFTEGSLSFSGASELMELMASGSQAHQCWAKKMTSYALERDLVEADRPLVEALGAVSQAAGSSLKQVMLALVKQDAFRTHVGGAK
jgi:hypothetical protein